MCVELFEIATELKPVYFDRAEDGGYLDVELRETLDLPSMDPVFQATTTVLREGGDPVEGVRDVEEILNGLGWRVLDGWYPYTFVGYFAVAESRSA